MAEIQRKFQELILYLAELSEADPRFGKTKLNKLLFYIDFRAYEAFGRSVSGEAYQKLSYGPAPVRLLPAVEPLLLAGSAAWAERDYYGKPLQKLVALRSPDLKLFGPEEIDLIQRVVRELWELNGSEVSDLSHRFPGWQAAAEREVIPYATVFIDEPRPLTEDEIAWAHQEYEAFRAELQGSR